MVFFDDIDNLAEPFWDIGGPKTTPKYNLTQFSLHYPKYRIILLLSNFRIVPKH